MDFKHMAQILDLAMDSAKGLHRSLEKLNYKNPKLVAPARVVEMLQYPTNMLLVTLESEMMGKANAEHAKAIKDYIGFLQNRSARR